MENLSSAIESFVQPVATESAGNSSRVLGVGVLVASIVSYRAFMVFS